VSNFKDEGEGVPGLNLIPRR